MKFADQTGITELITLTKTALKPLEAFKNSVTDVNGIVKSNGCVQVKNGRLVDNDIGEMAAFVLMGGKWHEVKGNKVL